MPFVLLKASLDYQLSLFFYIATCLLFNLPYYKIHYLEINYDV
jgi:hypothetical protein